MKHVLLVSCSYFHRKGHRAEDCFERSSNEAVDKRDVRILGENSTDDTSKNQLAKAGIVMFVEQEDDEKMVSFKCSATDETSKCKMILLNTISP